MTLGPDSNPHSGHGQNNTFDNANYYQRGLELAEAGRYQDALVCMKEYLQTESGDAEALNDTGAILHCLGRSNEAIDYFVKARKLRNDSVQSCRE